MSRPAAPIVCDGPGCQKHKQDVNHWWTIRQVSGDGALMLTPGSDDSLTETRWPVFDACGHECALKIVSEQMGKVSQ